MLIADILIAVAAAYLSVGLLIAVVFVATIVSRFDPGAIEAGWGFRLLIVPGCIALWPIVSVWCFRIVKRGRVIP